MRMEEVSPLAWYLTSLLLALTSWMILGYIRERRITRRLPPGPPRLPILGNLLQLGAKPHESLFSLASKYGPLMSLRLGKVATIVVTSPSMAKEILKTHDQIMCGRSIPCVLDALSHCDSGIVFAHPGQYWQLLRRLSTAHLFNKRTLDQLSFLRKKQVEHMISQICEKEDVRIADMVFGCVLNVIGNMVFGRDVGTSEEAIKELMMAVRDLTSLIGVPNLADYFPILKPLDLQGLDRRAQKGFQKIYDTLQNLIEMRQKDGVKKDDLISALLDCVDNETLTMHNLLGFLADIFNAATDTTTTTIEWAMAELMKSPEILKKAQQELKKAQQELDEFVGSKRKVTEEDCERLIYSKAIVKETLRLHPTLPLLLPHRAEEAAEVCGCKIPKHSQIVVNVWGIGRDPSVWSDPTVFDPERFLQNSQIDYKGQNLEFIPFGAGRRICLGLPLASIMANYILASLMHSFEWSLPRDVDNVDMSGKFGAVLQKALPLQLVPTPRLHRSLY